MSNISLPIIFTIVKESVEGDWWTRTGLFSLNEKAVNGEWARLHPHSIAARWSEGSMRRDIVFQVRVPMETGLAPLLSPRSGPSFQDSLASVIA